MLAGQRPVLIPSREEDPIERIRFGDQQLVVVPGHGGALTVGTEAIYLALGLRNGGAGVAVLHGWRVEPRPNSPDQRSTALDQRPDLEDFRRQQLDLYIPAGVNGYWLGALRDPSEPIYEQLRGAAEGDELVQVDLLYGDHEGGQRAIVRVVMSPWPDENDDVDGKRAYVIRYWNVDRDDPR
jgi:hypothetical protein